MKEYGRGTEGLPVGRTNCEVNIEEFEVRWIPSKSVQKISENLFPFLGDLVIFPFKGIFPFKRGSSSLKGDFPTSLN